MRLLGDGHRDVVLVLELSVVLDSGAGSGSASVVLDVLFVDGVSVGVGEVGEIVEGGFAVGLAGSSNRHASEGDDSHGELHVEYDVWVWIGCFDVFGR